MPKFMVAVTITAKCTYEVEVEASSESKAEDEATAIWREKTPEDFQVDKGYIEDWDTEIEQLTFECEDCGVPIDEEVSRKFFGQCESCDREFREKYEVTA